MRWLLVLGALGIVYYIGAAPDAKPATQTAPARQEAPSTITWAEALANDLGNPDPEPDTLRFIEAWIRAEGTAAAYNPLATSQPMPGSTEFNSHHVQNFTSIEQGLAATVITLHSNHAGYADIVEGIRTDDVRRAFDGLTRSPWGTTANDVAIIFNGDVDIGQPAAAPVPAAAPTGQKCPYTATMQVAENGGFYSTTSDAWSGQYGGMHLGADMVGNRGDPVYAPFDMVIDGEPVGVTYAPASPYLGWRIQAHFIADGVLFYAGHLVDVYVKPGQTVAACSMIGTLGATDGPHTHIKLGAPGAPVPCEGSKPGPTGCLDPIEYWESH